MSFLKSIGNGIVAAGKAVAHATYMMTFRGQFEEAFTLYKNKKISENEFIERVNRSHDELVKQNVRWETSEYRSRV